tara:strand:+ start:4558 stop:4977 length:420 start_codon:yes stop_codon:yes gene_type:complete
MRTLTLPALTAGAAVFADLAVADGEGSVGFLDPRLMGLGWDTGAEQGGMSECTTRHILCPMTMSRQSSGLTSGRSMIGTLMARGSTFSPTWKRTRKAQCSIGVSVLPLEATGQLRVGRTSCDVHCFFLDAMVAEMDVEF